MSMRERVATRLVVLYMENDGPLDGLTEADAVLDELMTPTKGMLAEAYHSCDDHGMVTMKHGFTAMIEAAKEGK